MSDIEVDSFYHLKKNTIDDPLRVLFDICMPLTNPTCVIMLLVDW